MTRDDEELAAELEMDHDLEWMKDHMSEWLWNIHRMVLTTAGILEMGVPKLSPLVIRKLRKALAAYDAAQKGDTNGHSGPN
jgi:hypothetical protein